jgi:hypothetical protein
MNTIDTLNLGRREIHAFQQWLKSLPKEQTLFLYQTYEKEEVRNEKLIALFNRYQAEKSVK